LPGRFSLGTVSNGPGVSLSPEVNINCQQKACH
jgi:hypothetical protein